MLFQQKNLSALSVLAVQTKNRVIRERSFVDIVLQRLKFCSVEPGRFAMKQPTFIIAEAGVNHNGSLDIAMKIVEVTT